MERKFGTFASVEELNRAAAAQKAEGDFEAVKRLALENGLEEADAQDYLDGETPELATPLMAALGKLAAEEKELSLKSQLKDWKDSLTLLCTENDDLCRAVFRPEKRLQNALAGGLRVASGNRVRVDKRIAEAAGLSGHATYIGMCGRDELRRVFLHYYLGEEET